MSARERLNLVVDVETAQEIHSSLDTLAGKIRWTLENRPPERPVQLALLKERLRLIEHATEYLKDALNSRVLKKPVLKSIK